MRLTTMATVCAVMYLMAGSSVLAIPPETTTGHFDNPGGVLGFCPGGFALRVSTSADFTDTTFFDNKGDAIRVVRRLTGTITFRNADTGKEVTGTIRGTITRDPRNGETVIETIGLVVLPGAGVLVIDAGRVRLSNGDLEDWGKHQINDGDFDKLCAALAD